MSLARTDGAIVNNILIENLGSDATEQDIRSLFAAHGTIDRFKIVTDSRTGQPKAFVELTDDAAAQKAIHATDGSEVRGRAVKVNAARPQLHRGAGKRD